MICLSSLGTSPAMRNLEKQLRVRALEANQTKKEIEELRKHYGPNWLQVINTSSNTIIAIENGFSEKNLNWIFKLKQKYCKKKHEMWKGKYKSIAKKVHNHIELKYCKNNMKCVSENTTICQKIDNHIDISIVKTTWNSGVKTKVL